MNKYIHITGASGFIGTNILMHIPSDYFVVAYGSQPMRYSHKRVRWVNKRLGDSIEEICKKYPPYISIHCAYAKNLNWALNTKYSKEWFSTFNRFGCVNQILLSSISVFQKSSSDYAYHKRTLEEIFTHHNNLILRLGLVTGDGGVCKLLRQKLNSSYIFPVVDPKKTKAYPVHVETVADFVIDSVKRNRKGTHLLVEDESLLMRDFLKSQVTDGNICLIIPVPYFFSIFIKVIPNFFFRTLGVTKNNVLGYFENARIRIKDV